MTTPPTLLCTPWCSGAAIQSLASVEAAASKALQANRLDQDGVDAACAQAAKAASEILFELSGRIFTGECGPATIRPVSRPVDSDTRAWGVGLSPLGWFSSWGMATSYGATVPGVVSHYGQAEPPTIKLPWPVLEILQVKIDGVVIPADEYELRTHQELVRMRVNAETPPTQRWGWPTSQIMDLPDTQPGTFSVTFTFGSPPPAAGQIAALKLGEVLALGEFGDTSRLPKRTVRIARQGVTADVASAVDVVAKGGIGIWEVDLFVKSVNPKGNQRQAIVWSPDVGRPRRQATPSLPS